MARSRVHATVSGLVQMVGFRAFAQREAMRLGLSGYARNTPSGDVEVEAEGDEDAVQELMDRLRRGPPAAQVARVSAAPMAPTNENDGFRIGF